MATDPLFCIPEGPDPGLVDHEPPPFAADANAAIVLHGIEAFGLVFFSGFSLLFIGRFFLGLGG